MCGGGGGGPAPCLGGSQQMILPEPASSCPRSLSDYLNVCLSVCALSHHPLPAAVVVVL